MGKKISRAGAACVLVFLLCILTALTGPGIRVPADEAGGGQAFSLSEVPAFSGEASAEVNGDVPYFTQDELSDAAGESFSDMDGLGRAGVARALVGTETMPEDPRGEIGAIRPSGWHLVKYAGIDGNYLYNRCHLIGYQLTGENANEKNLITGTRFLNVEGMLPYEDQVADYVTSTGNHVLYRVTPIFDGQNLLASGVLMEAESLEDRGAGLLFCAYCYNVQPGITIDYATGDSSGPEYTGEETQGGDSAQPASGGGVAGQAQTADSGAPGGDEPAAGVRYIVNTNTGKFHYPDCGSVRQMADHNKMEFTGSRDQLIAMGYSPCQNCNP